MTHLLIRGRGRRRQAHRDLGSGHRVVTESSTPGVFSQPGPPTPGTPLMLAAMTEAHPIPPAAQRIEDADWTSITVPLLALFGARRPVIDGPAAIARLRAVLPAAQAELVPGGHDLPVEQLVGRIVEFVRAAESGH